MVERRIFLIASMAAFIFVHSFPAQSGVGEGTLYGVMRDSRGKVVGTCSADIDLANDSTFIKATLVSAKRNRAYSSWQNHTVDTTALGNAHLDGAIAGGRTVIFTGTRRLPMAGDAAMLTQITVDVRDHGKPPRNASDTDIVDELTMPAPTSVGICTIVIPAA